MKKKLLIGTICSVLVFTSTGCSLDTLCSDNNDVDQKIELQDNSKIDVNSIEYNGDDVSDGIVESFSFNNSDEGNSYTVELELSGKVKLSLYDKNGNNKKEYIANDIVDIIHFEVPASSEYQLIYMLSSNGELYFYELGDSLEGNYKTTKVENIYKKISKTKCRWKLGIISTC